MQTVIGLFENAHQAQQAVQELESKGFTTDNIDVSVKEGKTSTGNYEQNDSLSDNTMTDTNTMSGTEYGSSNVSGLNTSDASSNYDDSRNDDSFGGKVSRFFKNLFGDNDDEVSRYSHVANRAGAVVTVHAQSEEEAERAADILDDNGAVDVNERAAEYGYAGRSGDISSGLQNSGDETNTLNVIKEDVQIGKKEVETGGVRLRSRIVERPVEETVRLREERVTVERQPVNRPATTADFQNFKEGEIEMTERAEIADVSKQARVVEEVKLSKEVNERTETVSETARDTEVDVENLSKNDATKKNKKKSL